MFASAQGPAESTAQVLAAAATAPAPDTGSTFGTSFGSFNSTGAAEQTPATTFAISPPQADTATFPATAPAAVSGSAEAYLATLAPHVRDFVTSAWQAGGPTLVADARKRNTEEFEAFAALEMAKPAASGLEMTDKVRKFLAENFDANARNAAVNQFNIEYQQWVDMGEPGLESFAQSSLPSSGLQPAAVSANHI
jgi:hypothetical protein